MVRKPPKLGGALIALNAIGFAVEGIKAIWGMASSPGPLVPFLMGAMIAGFWMAKRSRATWDTLEHEVTHGVLGELSGHKMEKIVATDRPFQLGRLGNSQVLGYCQSRGGDTFRMEHCRILGPYFFPTITVFLLLLRLTLGESVPWGFDLLLGASFGYHFASYSKQIPNAVHQALKSTEGHSDFARFGVFYSLAFVIMANLMVMPSILLVVHSGWMDAGRFLVAGQGFWLDLILK